MFTDPTLTVHTTDTTGVGVPAEVSIAVADLSVLALKGNPKKNPLIFFYNDFPLSVSTASNIKNILHEVDIPTGTKGGDGGAGPEDLAAKKRGVFKDTAYWNGSVTTDANGNATVSFTLPDNLTTWQIESLGVTKSTLIGVDYEELLTKKDLMAIPLKPRFVVPGDRFSLGATVFNQTDHTAKVSVSLVSETLELGTETTDTITLDANESKTVYFDAYAPEAMRAGEHRFTFTATADTFKDEVEQTISITPNTTYETVATAGASTDDVETEFLYIPDDVISGKGGLTIHANATLAVFTTDALTYMVTYPYGCSEQLASALSTIGVLTRALSVPNQEGSFETITHDGVTYTVHDVVAQGLARIYETQAANGGFAYYKGLTPDLSLSTHVLAALTKLKKAGFEVRDDVLTRVAGYIETEAKRAYAQHPDINHNALISAEYALRVYAPETETAITTEITKLIRNDAFLNEEISTMSLAQLAVITAKDYGWLDRKRVYDAFENRIDRDGRGAYLHSPESAEHAYYETSITNTALALKAFVAHEDAHGDCKLKCV